MKRLRQPILLVAAAGFAGCGGNQSALNPKSDSATELAHLSWVLFALGTFVLLIVATAILFALLGSERVRALLASQRAVVFGGIVFPIAVLTMLLVYGVWLTSGSQARLSAPADVRIKIAGEQWWWRIAYQGADAGPVISANELRIPVGRSVLLELTSADVIHSFWVPNLAGKIDMIPGRTTHLRLRAKAPGIYRGQCAEYCGGPHALMAFEVVAIPADAYDLWLKRQSALAERPASPTTLRGQTLFLSSGCGACHTVRGTDAQGTIGPDLTHLGSRRSVGLDTTPLTADAIARFIRDGQHIKPGNLMPPFRIFHPDELSALSMYLAELK